MLTFADIAINGNTLLNDLIITIITVLLMQWGNRQP